MPSCLNVLEGTLLFWRPGLYLIHVWSKKPFRHVGGSGIESVLAVAADRTQGNGTGLHTPDPCWF